MASSLPPPPSSFSSSSSSSKQSNKEARLAIMELSNMLSVPMALTAVVRLGVPNILSLHSPTPLSPSQILSLSSGNPIPNPNAVLNLRRLLRLLSSHGVFHELVSPVDASAHLYSLTEIGETLADDDQGNSFAAYVLQHHQDSLIRSWSSLHDAVTDPNGDEPFKKANGVSAYEYYTKDEAANELMRRAMWGVSVPFMEDFLDGYTAEGGFDGVGTLVDVGGSSGACLRMVMDRVEGVKVGVNFDLPDVVAGAPEFPGIHLITFPKTGKEIISSAAHYIAS